MKKNYLKIKFSFLIKAFIFYFLLFFEVHADNLNSNNFVSIGSEKAPVKIKIFSSLTCPHCANFHNNIVPKIKENYIETGEVQLIFIDFPLDEIAFNASKLLHCLDEKKQISFLDKIYKDQAKWVAATNNIEINKNLKKIAINFGLNLTESDKCLVNEEISDKILNGRIQANKKYSINSTPTIIINEKKLKGSTSFENIKKKIEKII